MPISKPTQWGTTVTRSATGPALLVVLAVASLTQLVPLLNLASSVCLRPISALAPLGLHFDLIAHSTACPTASYAPGGNLAPTVQFLTLLALVAIVAASSALLATFGVLWWVKRRLAGLRDAVRSAVTPATPLARLVETLALPVPNLAVAEVGIGAHRPAQRRGPPVLLG